MAKTYFLSAVLLGGLMMAGAADAQTPPREQREQREEDYEARFFNDWNGVTTLLNTKGIDAGMVDWQSIEPLCLSLQTAGDQVAYNKCKYRKVLELRRYTTDHDSCQRRAGAIYPDRLLTQSPVRTYTITAPDGSPRTVQETGQPLSPQELGALRGTEFDTCMHTMGWQDSNNWKAGLIPQPQAAPVQSVPVQTMPAPISPVATAPAVIPASP